MGQYTGNSAVYNNQIYIFDNTDLVVGGLSGTSNKPIKELADNSAYLKKFKGEIIYGVGEPDASDVSGRVLDADSLNNILYMDTQTGSFWKLTSTDPVTWENIYKSAILNINGLKVNNNGTESDYFQFSYNSTNNILELKDELGNYADVRVGRAYFDSIDGDMTTSRVGDDEIVLLYDANSNADAFYSVKRLEDISTDISAVTDVDTSNSTYDEWTVVVPGGPSGLNLVDPTNSTHNPSGECFIQIVGANEDTGEEINGYYRVDSIVSPNKVRTTKSFTNVILDGTGVTSKSSLGGTLEKDNSAQIKWDETNSYFSLQKRDGTPLPLNVSNFLVNGVSVSFYTDRGISNTTQFNELFANVDSTDVVDVVNGAKPISAYSTGTDQSLDSPTVHDTKENFIAVKFDSGASVFVSKVSVGSIEYDISTSGGNPGGYQTLTGSGSATYGAIKISFARTLDGDGDLENYNFSETSLNGIKTFTLPSGGQNHAGGYFQYYYHKNAWYNAIRKYLLENASPGIPSFEIAQNGSVYIESISSSNLVVRWDGVVGPAGLSNTCYLRKPESQYQDKVEDYSIVIKPNVDETDGHYDLSNNVRFIGKNVKIETVGGAEIRPSSDDITFSVINDNTIEVYDYDVNKFRVISDSTIKDVGDERDDITNRTSFVNDQKINTLSATVGANKLYKISSVKKKAIDLKNDTEYDTFYELSGNNAKYNSSDRRILKTISYNGDLYHTFITDPGNNLSIFKFPMVMDSTKKGIQWNNSIDLGQYGPLNSATTLIDTFIDESSEDFYVLSYETAGNRLNIQKTSLFNMSGLSAISQIPNAQTNIVSISMYVENGNVYILTCDTNGNLGFRKGSVSGTWLTEISLINNIETGIIPRSESMVVKDNVFYITYGKTDTSTGGVGSLSLAYGDTTDPGFVIGDITISQLATEPSGNGIANRTKITPSKESDANKPAFYVAYLDYRSAEKDCISFAELDVDSTGGPTLLNSYKSEKETTGPTIFDENTFDMYVSNENKYPSDNDNLIQIVTKAASGSFQRQLYIMHAYKRNSTTNVYDFDTFGLSAGATESLDIVKSSTTDGDVELVSLPYANNDGFIITYWDNNDDTGGKNHVFHQINYDFEIETVGDISPLGITDLTISDETSDNCEYKFIFDGNNLTYDNFFDLSNSVNSFYDITIRNASGTNAITAKNKGAFNTIKIKIDGSNNFSNNIDQVNHSNIYPNIIASSETGALNFNNCININVIGFVNTDSTIGNGTFNE